MWGSNTSLRLDCRNQRNVSKMLVETAIHRPYAVFNHGVGVMASDSSANPRPPKRRFRIVMTEINM